MVAVLFVLTMVVSGCATPERRSRGPSTDAEQRARPLAAILPPDAIWVESLDLDAVDQDWGTAQAGLSVDGKPLTIGGWVYAHGIGTHAYSEMIIDLQQTARRFEAVVGVDDETGDAGSVVFLVYVDGQEVWRSRILTGADTGLPISIDLERAQRLTLVVENGGDNNHYDHADWAGAMLVLLPGAEAKPVAIVPPAGPDPVIAADRALAPVINAPYITGTTPGLPFVFRVPTSGQRPMSFAAADLPAGLELDPVTGIIGGSVASEGTYDVEITATNEHGHDHATLTIVGGWHKLALTPPMGWNSWNVWGTSVDDAKVRAAADWMVASGLADHGYHYINIDDAWEGQRDADGHIQPNEKFPDMRALADYVHARGLKLGIYSSPGPETCAGYEGSYEHERLDAETFARWGIDLIKYDWCSYGDIAADDSRAELRKPYDIMRDALDACGRDIVYSLCQYGMGRVSEWGADVGANCWRTTGDIVDEWGSLSAIGFGQAGLEAYAGPGHWNDPDMLVVGMVGWGPDLHPSRLTRNEQVTHITLWSLLAAPLLIGCDLSQLDEFTLALLSNPEVVAVNQDPLGRQAGRIAIRERVEVWARPLADGTHSVGLFNRSRWPATVSVHWSDLGLTGPQPVRDLWLRADEGVFESGYAATVYGHGAVMLKVGTPRPKGPAAGTD
jgi:alpha-galactosidase